MFVLIAILMLLILTIWMWTKQKYNYWQNHGIPFIKPQFPYGSIKGVKNTVSIHDLSQTFYNQCKGKGPFFGAYVAFTPFAIASDIDFIKQILVRDFTSFENRGIPYDKENDPITAHLFAVDGDYWRNLRTTVTPAFTSGKMKFMYPTIWNIANRFKTVLNDSIERSENVIDAKAMLARFAADVMGTCAFGVECNTLAEPDALFFRMGQKISGEPRHGPFATFLLICFPKIGRILRIKTFPDDLTDFFMKLVKETIMHREANSNEERRDFMDLLIKMKNKSELDENNQPRSLTMDEIAAQSFAFFFAAFETSSSAFTYALYELASNKDVQTKARKEIKEVMKKYNGELTYEATTEMPYLNQIISETLRKYPPNSILFRCATKDYYVPEFDYFLPKDTGIWIPVYAIHHDPDYYPNPEIFDPERFTPEAIKNRNPATYLPFGDGPRNCIGARFQLMELKIGLSMLLNNFEFAINSKTELPLRKEPTDYTMSPKGGLYLTMSKVLDI